MGERMHFFKMRGSYSRLFAALYNNVVAAGIDEVYDDLMSRLMPEIPAGSRIVDVGCGPGHVSRRIAETVPGSRVVGVDLSPHMIAAATKRYGGRPNLEFRLGDALALPFGDGEFDHASSTASVKHWPDPVQGVREMLRVVKPGGRVLVVEVDRETSKHAADRFARLWKLRPPGSIGVALTSGYFRRFVAGQGATLAELRAIVEQAGGINLECQQERDWPIIWVAAVKPGAPA